MRTARARHRTFTHRRAANRAQVRQQAKAAQVWPDGKEFGSCSSTRAVSPSTTSQGRVRATKCLRSTLVKSRPKSMAMRAQKPAFRVLGWRSRTAERTIHTSPALPSWV